MTKLIIDANKKQYLPNLKEMYRYKDLFVTLAWRDFKVRYAQTSIGFLWAFLQPVITLIILTVVFRQITGVETNGTPHILFTITGLSIWTYFAFVLTNSGNSIIAAQGMVQKIYFPRLIIPLSKAVVGLIDFGITLIILIILMFYYNYPPSSNIIFAPIFIAIGMIAALSVGVWLSALTVRFRDFQHILPFMVQIGMFATPVAYPVSIVTERMPNWAMTLYYLNPMAGVVQGFRWSILGGEPPGKMMLVSFGMVILLFITSLFYFSRVEDKMADYI